MTDASTYWATFQPKQSTFDISNDLSNDEEKCVPTLEKEIENADEQEIKNSNQDAYFGLNP